MAKMTFQPDRLLLAGDVGATHTRLALYQAGPGGELRQLEAASPSSLGSGGLAPLIHAFLASAGHRPRVACLGLPGPVRQGRCQLTNLPWQVDERELAAELGLARVILLNDLEAQAHGLALLGPEDLLVLGPGDREARGNQALISAGTGLGEAGLAWDGRAHRPFATEGGHASFAPGSELEVELWRFLAARHGHVSWERVLSGPGLCHVFDFLCHHHGAPLPEWYRAAHGEDPAAAVTAAALAARDAIADEALQLFARLYGAEAGNQALKLMATGGVFVAGNLATQIRPYLASGAFRAGFLAKGRLRGVLEAMPIYLVQHPHLGVLGAARWAREAPEAR